MESDEKAPAGNTPAEPSKNDPSKPPAKTPNTGLIGEGKGTPLSQTKRKNALYVPHSEPEGRADFELQETREGTTSYDHRQLRFQSQPFPCHPNPRPKYAREKHHLHSTLMTFVADFGDVTLTKFCSRLGGMPITLIHHLFRLPTRGCITIRNGKLPYSDRLAPPSRLLYALKKPYKNRVSG